MGVRLKRVLTAALLAALCASAGSCAKADYPSPVTATDHLLRARVDTASAMIDHGGLQAVVEDLGRIVSSPDYANLSDGYRHEIDELLGMAAYRSRRLDIAEQELRRASQSSLATDDDRALWLQTAVLNSRFDDAYAAFQALIPHAAGFENGLGDRNISDMDVGLGALPDPRPQRVWEAYLDGQGWQAHGDRVAFETVRFDYAVNLLDDGKPDAARKVAGDLSEPDVLVRVAADRRFDAIRAADPDRFDPVASTERRLARFRLLTKADPSGLNMQTAVVSETMRLGRLSDALTVLQPAISSGGGGTLTDGARDPSTSWAVRLAIRQEIALLFALGRRDEALGIAEGAQCTACGPNFSWALMQTRMLVAVGRGREALDRLNAIPTDALGLRERAEQAAYKVCAAELVQDASIKAAQLLYLRSRRLADPAALVTAELCLGDLDGAAAAAEESLADPRERAGMLEALQVYLPPPSPTAWQSQMAQRMDALRARVDLQAAVNRVGRIRQVGLIDMNAI